MFKFAGAVTPSGCLSFSPASCFHRFRSLGLFTALHCPCLLLNFVIPYYFYRVCCSVRCAVALTRVSLSASMTYSAVLNYNLCGSHSTLRFQRWVQYLRGPLQISYIRWAWVLCTKSQIIFIISKHTFVKCCYLSRRTYLPMQFRWWTKAEVHREGYCIVKSRLSHLDEAFVKWLQLSDLSFWTSFPVKLKSRRFSKTVASDFGSVSSRCVLSDLLTLSLRMTAF